MFHQQFKPRTFSLSEDRLLHFNWIPLVIIFNMIGKVGISASYNVMYLYTSEIFPTEIRSFGLGICDFAGYVAYVVAPYSRLSVSIRFQLRYSIDH